MAKWLKKRLNITNQRLKTYKTREDWKFFVPCTSEDRKKLLKALRNQRYYDNNRV